MALTLYSNSFNSAGERVRIACALKNIEYEYVSIRDIGWDAYETVNPQRILPTLKVDDALITQSTAILEFLEEAHPEPALLPADPILRAQSRALGQAVASEMHAIDVRRVRGFLTDDLGVNDVGVEAWSDHWFVKGFSAIEAILARRSTTFDYCYGNTPGWADVFLVPQVRKATVRFKLDMTPYPLIESVFARCVDQPAFLAAAPENQTDYVGLLGTMWAKDDTTPEYS